MALFFKRRTFLIVVFALIFVVSVYLMFLGNIPKVVVEKAEDNNVKKVSSSQMENIPEAKRGQSENQNNFFIDYKLERDRLRSQEADYLRELINNPNAAQQSRDKAQQDLIALSQKMEKEMVAENLIKAKGFEDAVIFLSNDFANVVIKSSGLSQKDVAQITDIVTRTTNIPIEKITIIERR